MQDKFKLQAKSNRLRLAFQAVSQARFNPRAFFTWLLIISVAIIAGLGIFRHLKRRAAQNVLAPQPAATPGVASGLSDPPPQEPSVAAPYFTTELNAEIERLRIERQKHELGKPYQEEMQQYLAGLSASKTETTSSELTSEAQVYRLAVKENIADQDIAARYKLEDTQRYTIPPLPDKPTPPPPRPEDKEPPIRPEPNFFQRMKDELARDLYEILRDIVK